MTVTYEGAVAPAERRRCRNAAGPGRCRNKSEADPRQGFRRADSSLPAKPRRAATATFDTATQIAVLEGDVVLTQGDDKKAVGDRAEYDQAAQTMVLTGPVVVTQGANILKGRRLVFNRATNKMQLTAPGTDRRPGRITAHFVKPDDETVGKTIGLR